MEKKAVLRRKRIESALENIFEYPLTIVEAPMGYGKTTAVWEYLTRKGGPSLWISFPSPDNTVSFLWDGISRGIERLDRSVGITLGNLGFPYDADREAQFFRILDGLNFEEKTTFVMDDFHLVKGTQIGNLLVQAAKERLRNLSVVIITRDLTYLEFIELFSKGLCQIISQNMIRFTDAEIRDYCVLTGYVPSREDLKKICGYADGWITAVYLVLLGLQKGIPVGMNSMIDELVENTIFNFYEKPVRQFLLHLSVWDSFTERQAMFITGAEAKELLKALRKENAFLSYNDATGIYRIQNVLLDFLRRKQAGSAGLPGIYRKAGEWCFLQKDFVSAYEYLYRSGDTELILLRLSEEGTLTNSHVKFKGYAEMFGAAPRELLFRYPFAYLQYIGVLLLSGKASLYKDGLKRLYELRAHYKKEKSLIPKSRNLILGEISAVHILASFNNAEKMISCCQKATGLLGGCPSRLFTRESEFTCGNPQLLFAYYKEPGKLKETTEIIAAGFPNFSLLADGCGTGCEYVVLSEYALETGAWETAELNAFKAYYKAAAKEQTGVWICAVFVLLRLYILQSRMEEGRELFNKVRADLEKKNSAVLNATLELVEWYISSCFGFQDKIPPLLRTSGAAPVGIPYQGMAFRNIIYERTVLLSKKYIELEMITDTFHTPPPTYGNLLGLIHNQILNSVAKYHLYGMEKGCASLKKALELGRTDHIVLTFAEYAGNILKMVQCIARENQGDEYLEEILKYCEQYLKSIKKNTRNAYSLSCRELEILTLASEGLTRSEIANRLCVSAGTIQTHLHNIYRKLGVSGKTAAIKKLLNIKYFY